MKIRRVKRAGKRLLEAINSMLPQLSPGSELLSDDTLKRILSSKNTFLFVCEAGRDQIAGMITLVTYELSSGKKAWIEDVVVDESYRGRGAGKEMMLHVIEFSRTTGAKTLTLTSRPSRIAANKLYSDLGFEKYETNVYKLNL
jgi:ribosomal protein S18 acetylase RimI-like enzyme